MGWKPRRTGLGWRRLMAAAAGQVLGGCLAFACETGGNDGPALATRVSDSGDEIRLADRSVGNEASADTFVPDTELDGASPLADRSFGNESSADTFADAVLDGLGQIEAGLSEQKGHALDATIDQNHPHGGFDAACPLGIGGTKEYMTGKAPTGSVLADLNGDGKLDLVLANSGDAQVGVYLGDGLGGFQPPVTYATGSNPSSIATGDFNGDNVLDLAVANNNDTQKVVSVLLGKGDGTFASQVQYAVNPNPAAVAIGDVSGDQKADLVVANEGNGSVSVLLGDGTGSLLSQQTWGDVTGADALGMADLNGDGRLDLLVGGSVQNGMTVLLGASGGQFPTQSSYFGYLEPASLAITDLNGDGKYDVVFANPKTYDITAALGLGDGTFLPRVSYPLTASPTSVAVADLNGDGALDVAVGTSITESQAMSTLIFVFLGNGDGTFENPVTFAAGSSPSSVTLGDLDGDGLADAVVANKGSNTVTVLLFDRCGGAPGQPPPPSICVMGTPCSGTINWTCSGGQGSDSCTQACDCRSMSTLDCALGCP